MAPSDCILCHTVLWRVETISEWSPTPSGTVRTPCSRPFEEQTVTVAHPESCCFPSKARLEASGFRV